MERSLLIYTPQLEHLGGIERVVVERSRIFAQAGHRVAMVTDREVRRFRERVPGPTFVLPQDPAAIDTFWQACLRQTGAQHAILDGRFTSHFAAHAEALRRQGVRTVLVIHFSFPCAVLLNGDHDAWFNFRTAATACDAVATVSAADATFWRALDVRAFHVQNPFVVHGTAAAAETKEPLLLWVGRHCEQKRPDRALDVLARVLARQPEARLAMIGGDARSAARLRAQARRLRVAHAVEIVPETPDLSAWYRRASVALVTSLSESFGLVLAEAKSHRLPIVMAEIPFLDLVADGRGIVTVPQGDLDGLADATVALLRDPARRQRLGAEGHETLAGFHDRAVLASWEAVFDDLAGTRPVAAPALPAAEAQLVRELYQAWEYHRAKNEWKIRLCDDSARHLGISLRPVARLLQAALAWGRGASRRR